ncbi:MAG: hypothetical protein D3M94_14030 [Rhodocyclales bacterium GT-UBC]|nr:MAG: hypothetical protein D3M94_14030 [Rhodocyclales bacterium GT-UBC]
MFNTHFTAAQRDSLLVKIIEQGDFSQNIGFCQGFFAGSQSNPLKAFRQLTILPESGFSIDAEVLADLTGVPAAAFEAETLNLPEDQLLTAVGKLALIWLESVRRELLSEYIKLPVIARADDHIPDLYTQLIQTGGLVA